MKTAVFRWQRGSRALLCTFAVAALTVFGEAHATTACDQTFKLLALTGQPGPDSWTPPVFWLSENVGGECSVSFLLLVALGPSGGTLTSVELHRYDDWRWADEAVKHLERKTSVPLKLEKNALAFAGSSCQVKAPARNAKLAAAFSDHVSKGGYNGTSWNKERGQKGVVLPRFEGFEAQLLYYLPAGLYVNYRLGPAYYFPESGYLLVFTKQDQLATGMDTMHGFMVFKNLSRVTDPCSRIKDPCAGEEPKPCPWPE